MRRVQPKHGTLALIWDMHCPGDACIAWTAPIPLIPGGYLLSSHMPYCIHVLSIPSLEEVVCCLFCITWLIKFGSKTHDQTCRLSSIPPTQFEIFAKVASSRSSEHRQWGKKLLAYWYLEFRVIRPQRGNLQSLPIPSISFHSSPKMRGGVNPIVENKTICEESGWIQRRVMQPSHRVNWFRIPKWNRKSRLSIPQQGNRESIINITIAIHIRDLCISCTTPNYFQDHPWCLSFSGYRACFRRPDHVCTQCCKGSVSCGNETRDLWVMPKWIKWEEYAPERMHYCTACASLTKGAIYSWHKAQPSIRITYHTATPFPNAILKGLNRQSPCTPFHNITLQQY